ncbi:MAG TPA: FtsX-like permease family protein [Chitinophagaceae bacterium]|nr:FtsX-like permease family protein [Chitinophagaceae bacterium]
MRLPYFIAKRIAFNRERTFSRFIIRIALIATSLSVAVMLLTVALVNGFQEEISHKVFDFWGHVHVTTFQPYSGLLTEDVPIKDSILLKKDIAAMPDVASISVYAHRSAILKVNKEIEGVMFKGIDSSYDWQHLTPYLKEGNKLTFADSGYTNQIIISRELANDLKLKLHDPFIAYFVQKNSMTPKARKLVVGGIYKTSISDYDETFIIGDINLLRDVNGWDKNKIGGYEIFLNHYNQVQHFKDRLYHGILPRNLVAMSIYQINPNIFDWLNLQNMNELIILIIMAIVAIINMITAILILILERVNMIGVVKSLGMNNWQIQKIFLYQMGYITIVGLFIGNVIGLGIAWLQKTTGFFALDEKTYYMSTAPVKIEWWQVVGIDLATLIICLLVLIIPTLIVRKISPVKAVSFK